MARERRLTPPPELPSESESKILGQFDLSDSQPVALPPSEKKAKRKRRPSKEAVTSSRAPETSGEIELTDEDLKEMIVPEAKAANDNGPREGITVNHQPEEPRAEAAPPRKRAKREVIPPPFQHVEARREPDFSQAEEAWFKQGEDGAQVQALAEKQQAEDARQEADVRRHIAESYDGSQQETIIDTDQEVDAAARQAETMIASGELNPQLFNANDYRYLLLEKARLDRELETAGWWAARKLRTELRDAQKGLAEYEQQIQSVHTERAGLQPMTAREKAGLTSTPRAKLPPGSGTTLNPEAKEGSGTSIHANRKPGFFARLFAKK